MLAFLLFICVRAGVDIVGVDVYTATATAAAAVIVVGGGGVAEERFILRPSVLRPDLATAASVVRLSRPSFPRVITHV